MKIEYIGGSKDGLVIRDSSFNPSDILTYVNMNNHREYYLIAVSPRKDGAHKAVCISELTACAISTEINTRINERNN